MNLAPGITLVCQWNYENKHVTKCKNAKDKTYILAIAFIITIYLIDQIIDYNDWHFNMLPDKNVSNNIAYFNFLILIISTLFSNIGWSSLVDTTAASLEENLQVSDYHATHDPLTGLKNRKSLDKYIEKINAKKLQYIFLLGDIDHFKIINDTYGHDCGDYILIEISKILQQNIRSSDQIFRWGGEEIVIIFPETTVNNVYSKAENLRSEIQNSIFTYQDKKIDVTISIGISSSHNKSFIETFKEADSFLYYAKEHGRNMTVYYKN